jgi:hypothetical protein
MEGAGEIRAERIAHPFLGKQRDGIASNGGARRARLPIYARNKR